MLKDHKRIHLLISGRVQGVGFRWFVATDAERLGLRGWVRNTLEGFVELEAIGPEEAIAEFCRRVERGPPAARVHLMTELTPGADRLPDGFEIFR